MFGLALPSDVLEGFAGSEVPMEAHWFEDGISNNPGDYAIVEAFFSQKPEASVSYYLFALVNEQPIVLVSQQSEAQPDGLIHFQPTSDKILQTGFQQIIVIGSFE